MRKFTVFIFGLLISLLSAQESVFIGDAEFEVREIIGGIDIPWEIRLGPDGHIWFTERVGRISRLNVETGERSVILDHTSIVFQQFESGMLGLALHPDFENTPELFVAYTYRPGNQILERLSKFTWNGEKLIDEEVLIDNIPGNTTHNGSRLVFLPDGTLLMTTGDAQNVNLPQNIGSLAGKVLRVNPDGSIPDDNPFPGSLVYSFGFRNSQGMCLTPNGRIFMSEHGTHIDDEFNELFAGRNYGWPQVEGFCQSPAEIAFCNENNVVEPFLAWTPTIAPSDLILYQNPLVPELHNSFLMTVLKDRMLVVIKMNDNMTEVIEQSYHLENIFGRLRDIEQDENGTIYLATNGQSWTNNMPNAHRIIALKPKGISNVKDEITASSTWKIYPNPATDHFFIESADVSSLDQVEIWSLSGQLISKIKIGQEYHTSVKVNLGEDITPGMYMVKIRAVEKVWVEKLIVR
jgi:aldose sugar dehydrogenase